MYYRIITLSMCSLDINLSDIHLAFIHRQYTSKIHRSQSGTGIKNLKNQIKRLNKKIYRALLVQVRTGAIINIPSIMLNTRNRFRSH